jgi:hypothetical protein
MHNLWQNIHHFFSNRQQEYLRVVLSKQNFQGSTLWHHNTILRKGKQLATILSDGECDEKVIKGAFDLYQSISYSWYWLLIDHNETNESDKENIPIRQKESKSCIKYHELDQKIFYMCSEVFLEALIMAKQLTSLERDEYLGIIRKNMTNNSQ